MRITKKKAEKLHAKKRFKERLNIEFTKDLHDQLIKQIQKGESFLVKRDSNRVAIHAVKITNKYYRVVYDKIRKEIVTVMI